MRSSKSADAELSVGQRIELPKIGSRDRYDSLMEVVRNRVTVRKFDENFVVPECHYELYLLTPYFSRFSFCVIFTAGTPA